MATGISRRRFIKGAATALAVPTLIAGRAFGAEGTVAPSNRVGLGFVGCGAMNGGHMSRFIEMPDVHIAAVCDVNAQKRQERRAMIEERYAQDGGQGSYAGCKDYNDFRDLIADENVDAVVVATPDHWHTLSALAAVRAGKDVYLEKPMTLTIEEGRVLADEVKRTGRVLQVGSHQRSTPDFHHAVELVRNGRIGALRTIEVGIHAGYTSGDCSEEPVPDYFDYDFWLGQAPWAPYCAARCMGVRPWMYISDYSGGRITEWGSHHLDIAQWALDADGTGPLEIEGTGAYPKSGLMNTAITWRVEMRYASGVTVLFTDNRQCAQGVKFIGDDGWVFVNREEIRAEPAEVLDSVIGPDETLLRTSGDHRRNFLDCIRSREATVCTAEIGHRTATACHLANICVKLGRKLRWDPARERFIDDAEADALISRKMRAPWSLQA